MAMHTPDNHSPPAYVTSFASNIADGVVTDVDISEDECDVDEVEDILSHAPAFGADICKDRAEASVDALDAAHVNIPGANVALSHLNFTEGGSISTGPYRVPHHHVEVVQTLPANGVREVSAIEAEPPSPRMMLTTVDKADSHSHLLPALEDEHKVLPEPPSVIPALVTLKETRTAAEQPKKRKRKNPRLTRVKNAKAKVHAKKAGAGGELAEAAGEATSEASIDEANKKDHPTKALTEAATKAIERVDVSRKAEEATMKRKGKGKNVELLASEDTKTGGKRRRDEIPEVDANDKSRVNTTLLSKPERRTRRRLDAPAQVRRPTPEPPCEDLNVRQLRWTRIQLPPVAPPTKKRGVKRARAMKEQLEDEENEPSRKRSRSVEEESPINISTPSPLSSPQQGPSQASPGQSLSPTAAVEMQHIQPSASPSIHKPDCSSNISAKAGASEDEGSLTSPTDAAISSSNVPAKTSIARPRWSAAPRFLYDGLAEHVKSIIQREGPSNTPALKANEGLAASKDGDFDELHEYEGVPNTDAATDVLQPAIDLSDHTTISPHLLRATKEEGEESKDADADVLGMDRHGQEERFHTPPRRRVTRSSAKKKKVIDLTGDSDDESWKVGLSPPRRILTRKLQQTVYNSDSPEMRLKTPPPPSPSWFERMLPCSPPPRSPTPSPRYKGIKTAYTPGTEESMWAPMPSRRTTIHVLNI